MVGLRVFGQSEMGEGGKTFLSKNLADKYSFGPELFFGGLLQ